MGGGGDGVYILTCGVEKKSQALRLLGLKTPETGDSFFSEFRSGLINRLEAATGFRVVEMDLSDLAGEIVAKAEELRALLGKGRAIIVSACSDICSPDGHAIEINRLISQNGQSLGRGPRPGRLPIAEQIAEIAAKANGQGIIIVDDGSFSGGTQARLIHDIEKSGSRVIGFVAGLIFPRAREEFDIKGFRGPVVAARNLVGVDWLPDHDFFPFVPNCGKIVGQAQNGAVTPYYGRAGETYSLPYLKPFITESMLQDWASIPPEAGDAFSLFCLQAALEFFKRLEEMNGRPLTLADLVKPRNGVKISVPIATGQNGFPRLETRVTEYLHNACQKLV